MDNPEIERMEHIIPQSGHIHLVGIGGVGMSGLALLLRDKGYSVSGSDLKESAYLNKVREAGVSVSLEHCPENVNGAQVVCYSSAIKPDNPEFSEALRQGIPLIKRGALLGAISRDKKVIAVSGSHGKTTTSALLTFLLSSCGYEPAAFIGAQPFNYEKTAWWGKDMFVVEADESDGSFLFYSPWVAIVTNIDREHMDFYKDEGRLREMFSSFLNSARESAIVWGDSPELPALVNRVKCLTYGFNEENLIRAGEVRVQDGHTVFDLRAGDAVYKDVKISLLGEHNVLNALAALALFYYLGEDLNRVLKHLADFKSTGRRFQVKGRAKGVTFVDDYAHHPTEIMATLKAARMLEPARLVIVFQPHRFSRARLLQEEFSRAFSRADLLIITDVYAAGEIKPDDFDESLFREKIGENFKGQWHYLPKSELAAGVPGLLREGDLVLCLGAGDINVVSDGIFGEYQGH